MKSKFFSLICLTLIAALLLCSCGKKPTEVPPEDEIIVEEPPKPEYKSSLTGLPVDSEEDENRRPVAVMINNIKKLFRSTASQRRASFLRLLPRAE